MKHYILIIVLFFLSCSKGILDEPLTPKQWSQKMKNGCWLIPYLPQREVNDPFGLQYSPAMVKKLKEIGITGCRLHISKGGYAHEGRAGKSIHDIDGRIYKKNVDYISSIIDDFTQNGMAVLLQMCVEYGDEVKSPLSNHMAQERALVAWEQLSKAYKDKSHLLIMSPVIESHAFQYLKQTNIEKMLAGYNSFLDKATVIFRKYNPTRIMAYKPWGAARGSKMKAINMNTALRFPYGNDPDWTSGVPYYYLALVGDIGKGHVSLSNTIKPAAEFRSQTGIEVVSDHWYAHRGDENKKVNAEVLTRMTKTYEWIQQYKIPNCVNFPRWGYWDADTKDWDDDEITKQVVGIISKSRW
jgi:hypothetical protein